MQILYPSLSQSLAGLRGKPAPDTEVLSIFVSPAAQVRHSDAVTAIASVSEAFSLPVNTIPGELPGEWLAPSEHCHFSLFWEHSTRPARLSVRPSGVTEVRVQSPCLPCLGAQWVSRDDVYTSSDNPGRKGTSWLLCGMLWVFRAHPHPWVCVLPFSVFCLETSFSPQGSEQRSSRVSVLWNTPESQKDLFALCFHYTVSNFHYKNCLFDYDSCFKNKALSRYK